MSLCIAGSVGQELKVLRVPDFSNHPLVLGDLYEEQDIQLAYPRDYSPLASGEVLDLFYSPPCVRGLYE